MSKTEIIILACITAFPFMAYLLIGLFSKISQSSEAKHSKTMDDLEQ